MLLELPKAVLVHRLALGHTIRKLNQRQTASLISLMSVYETVDSDVSLVDTAAEE